jgi:hypothetical protein
MAERLAALGIKAPTKTGETTQQRLEREKNERAAKLRQAEEEDAKREAERQARINEEQGIPPPPPASSTSAKRPPPPPSRKAAKSDASERKAEVEQRVLQEQKAQIIATADLEYVKPSPKFKILLTKIGMMQQDRKLNLLKNARLLLLV